MNVTLHPKEERARVTRRNIHSEVAGRELEIIAALGIQWPPPARQTHIHCPCQGHNDSNPSWRWDKRKGRWFCTCGSGNEVDLVMKVLGLDFADAAAWMREKLFGERPDMQRPAIALVNKGECEAQRIEGERADAEHRTQRLQVAQAIYGRSVAAASTPVERYLRSRGITIPVPRTFRFLPATPRYPHPCMLAPYGFPGPNGPTIHGIHLTKLKLDGSGKADVPRDEVRRSIGGHGWPIELAPVNDGGGLAIGEGIETMLSVAQVTGLGAWAAGAASWMPALTERVPSYVEAITLYAEPDRGRLHADRLAERLDERGFEVTIAEVGR